MSPPSLSHQYTLPAAPECFEQCYDTYSPLIVPARPDSASDFYTSENLYLWQDGDGTYQWTDAPVARSDSCLGYSSPPYYSYPFSSETVPLSDYFGYRHGDLEELPHPATIYDNNPYIFQLAQQVRSSSGRPQVQDHRSSIARASDNFLAQGTSIFSDGHSSKRGSIADYRHPSTPHQTSPQRDPRPPSRKRSRESLDEGSYHLKEDDNAHLPSLTTANDPCRLPPPPMTAPSQAVLPQSSVRIPRRGDANTPLSAESHAREHEPRLGLEQRCTIPVPKHMSNKRLHRSSEELVRQECAIPSTRTWPIPDDQVMKGTKKPGEQKKQALACLFCRERKIACGRPPPHSSDPTCNQCSRRGLKCEYPTESRRGQHKRRRKPIEGEPASQSVSRTNPASTAASSTTAPSSTILTTTTTPSA